MSLGTPERMFAGHEQTDCAALTADGIFYRCYIWLSRVEQRIEAACFRVQANGTEVEVFRNIIARASSGEITETNGVPLDCPKILASGTTFVVHWLQATDIDNDRNWQLYRATMDMESFSTTSWDSRGAVAVVETHGLYDAQPVIGTDDFVVARYTDASETTVQRFNLADGYDWVDAVWLAQGSTSHAARVLGVYAHEADNDVVWTFQHGSNGTLTSVRCNATDGGSVSAPNDTFTAFASSYSESLTEWVQVGHCYVEPNQIAVVAEARAAINENQSTTIPSQGWIHHVLCRVINSTTCARVGNEHWAANLSMHSRPWSYASGTSVTGPRLDVYVMLTFRSVMFAREWSQAAAFACNLDFSQWQDVSSGAGLRPRPIGTIQGNSIGIPDARTSGWKPTENTPGIGIHTGGPSKRMNHLASPSAAPPFGPDVKTRTVPLVFFNSIRTTSDLDDTDGDGEGDAAATNTGPEGAGVRGIVVYMEDPWTVYRDSTDPDQPVENFAFPYPRAMHQTAPWGRGLFVAGGTPQLYDGSTMVECGFLWRPEVIAYGTDTGGEMEVSLESRQYYFVYSWMDRQGQIHRSAPSEVITIAFGMDTAASLEVRTMTVSLKDADAFYPLAESIQIEVYRTIAGGTEFFRVYGATDVGGVVDQRPRDTPVNDPEVLIGYVDIDDGVSDAQLAAQGFGPYLYDATGVFIEPLPQVWPACHAVAVHANRLVAADSLNPSQFVYSDENGPDPGAATYAAPIVGTGQQFPTGEIQETTGFQSEGSVLYQFTRDRIYALASQDAGFGLLAWTSQLIHEALGCVDPKSLVLFPLGIGFQSLKGYYTLARSGEASYGVLARSRDQPGSKGGAAIEDDIRDTGNIRAASHNPTKHRIDLVCNGRPTVTQTWTGTITTAIGGSPASTWTITGLDEAVVVAVANTNPASTVANLLGGRIRDLIAEDAPDTLQFQVAECTDPGSTIVIELQPGETATLAGSCSSGGLNEIEFVLTEALTTNPQRLSYHYDVEQWSRADLVQTNTNTRLAELVDGCYWQAQGGARHVALAQGGVLVERLPSDDLAYADQTSSGVVGIPIDVTTAWIHIAGIAGAQVLDEIVVQTERSEAGAVSATLEYDNDGSYTGIVLQPTEYDWQSPAPADMRVRPRYRRGRAFRLRVYESAGVTSAGATFSLQQFVIVVGVQPGVGKVRGSTRGAA